MAQFTYRICGAVEQQSSEHGKVLIDSISSFLLYHWLQFLREQFETMGNSLSKAVF